MRAHARRCRAWFGALVVASVLDIAAEQSVAQAPLPGPAQPGQIQERFRPAPGLPERRDMPPLPPAPQSGPTEDGGLRFRLSEIVIEGNTVYPPETLRPLYAELLGSEVTLARIAELAQRLTARYRQDGYILAQAVVPEQQIDHGVVRLRVVEGFVDRVLIEGDVVGPRRIVEEFAERIRAARPLTAAALERNLLLIGDLPGVNVQGVLEPSPSTFGAADLRVVLRHLPYEGFGVLDNRGSRFVGPWTATVGVSTYSLLGLYDQIDLLAAVTPDSGELGYLQAQFTIPVGPVASGDTLQFFASGTRTRPNIPADIFPFEAKSTGFEGRVTYFTPLLRSRPQNFSGRLSFIWRDTDTRIADLPEDGRNPTKDKARLLQLRGTYDLTDRLSGVNLVDASLNQGLDILGASGPGGRVSRLTGAGGGFTYANLTLSRLQQLAEQWSLYGEAIGQYSGDPLLPSERFYVGGARFGRGFPPGNISGDHGIAGKLELRYGENVGNPFLDSYQAYGFIDAGRTWDVGDTPHLRAELLSAGLGARLNLTERISLNPELAHQLLGTAADRNGGGHEVRFLVSLVARF